MVAQALEYMRDASAREATSAVDLTAMLETLQSDFREQGHEATITGQAAAPYQGRPLSLRRCLTNLIDNALLYGGRAEIAVADSAEQLVLRILDTGPGIPQDQLERAFEPFFRGEASRNRETGGTGLGLGIARNIARAHGGDVVLRNRVSGGLEAFVTLARSVARHAERGPSRPVALHRGPFGSHRASDECADAARARKPAYRGAQRFRKGGVRSPAFTFASSAASAARTASMRAITASIRSKGTTTTPSWSPMTRSPLATATPATTTGKPTVPGPSRAGELGVTPRAKHGSPTAQSRNVAHATVGHEGHRAAVARHSQQQVAGHRATGVPAGGRHDRIPRLQVLERGEHREVVRGTRVAGDRDSAESGRLGHHRLDAEIQPAAAAQRVDDEARRHPLKCLHLLRLRAPDRRAGADFGASSINRISLRVVPGAPS